MDPNDFTPRQQELFQHLLRDVLAQGFSGFTIDRAVRDYHCSKSTIYALGRNRDEILRQLLISFFRDVTRQVTAATEQDGSCAQQLDSYFTAMARALEPASAAFMRDMAREQVAQEVYSVNTQAAVAQVDRLLTRGVAEGEFTLDSVEFTSQLIQRSLTDIQQGFYHDVLPTGAAYAAFGRLVLGGLAQR